MVHTPEVQGLRGLNSGMLLVDAHSFHSNIYEWPCTAPAPSVNNYKTHINSMVFQADDDLNNPSTENFNKSARNSNGKETRAYNRSETKRNIQGWRGLVSHGFLGD